MNHEMGFVEEDYSARMSDLKLWQRLVAFIAPQWRWVVLAVILSFIITGTSLMLPRIMQIGLDRYIVNAQMEMEERIQGIGGLSFYFIVLICIGFIANFFQVLVLEWTGQRIMQSLRQRLFSHVLDLDLSFFNSLPIGKLVTRLTNDIQNLYEMFTSVIITLFNEGVRLAGILAIMFWLNWSLALILSATFPIMMVITLWFGRLSRNAFRRIRAHLAEINAFIQESISGMTVIQLFLREADLGRRIARLNGKYRDAAFYQIHVFGIFVPLIEVMNSVAMALIIWYGGGEIIRDNMTIGILAAFISYMRLFFQPLRELSQKYTIVQSAMTSAERIFELLETRNKLPAPDSVVIPGDSLGTIEFSGIEFEYEPGRPVIRDLSLKVRTGETLAIIGATGSGKTTIINLLERFYDPVKGVVLLNGADLRKVDSRWLREQVGIVMQDVFIVPGSIRENILLDRRVSEEDLRRIVALSQLSDLVDSLPDGLNTRIGEGGMNLSAGQKQLLAFGRVLARNPRVLVLDEATANVDTETEMLVERAIQAAMHNRTSIVIAHRLSTIRRADRIVVMDAGRIVEEGTHDSLMAAGGLYHHLQTLQNGTNHENGLQPEQVAESVS